MHKIVIFLLLSSGFALAQENIVSNPEFDNGKTGWVIKNYNTAAMTYEIKADGSLSGDNYLAVTISQGGDSLTDVAVYQNRTLKNGRIYTLSFMATAGTEHAIQVILAQSTGEKTVALEVNDVRLSATPQTFGPFTTSYRGQDSGHRLYFYLGGQDDVVVNLDAVSLIEADDPAHLRVEEKFAKSSHTFAGRTLPYGLCTPDRYDPQTPYPMVLALHGAGERGTDNEMHILVHRMATSWADSLNQLRYPCFVLAPQCPENSDWIVEMCTVVDLLDSLIRVFPVDTNRLYVTGLSMGGYGTWELLARYPNKFAAAIPMSGGGDTTTVDRMMHIPIWNFHGEKDSTVPVSESRDMIDALERRGATCIYTHCQSGDCTCMPDEEVEAAVKGGAHLLYTEWQGKDHVMWAESYDYPWLFPWVFGWNKTTGFSSVERVAEQTAAHFSVQQNYPNPFNPVTRIDYELYRPGHVRMDVLNLRGQPIARLVDEMKAAGPHSIHFDATGLDSGPYFLRLSVDQQAEVKKMLLVK